MTLMRLLGGILGAAAFIFGIYAIFFLDERGHILVGISGVGTGAYFLNYAITGHRYLFYRKGKE